MTPRCPARHPHRLYQCRLRQGHDGPHHAWAVATGGGDDTDLVWPEPPPFSEPLRLLK